MRDKVKKNKSMLELIEVFLILVVATVILFFTVMTLWKTTQPYFDSVFKPKQSESQPQERP